MFMPLPVQKKIKGKRKSRVAEFINEENFDMPRVHVTEFLFHTRHILLVIT